jgi:hypothetical protein
MNRRFSMVGAACVATLSLPTACGSDSPHAAPPTPTSAHGAFVALVSHVCDRAVSAHQGHDFPVEGFDPLNPDPSQLPTVGDYFANYGRLPEIEHALHTLRPPSADAADWADLLRLVDRVTGNSQTQVRAARGRDVATFVATVRKGELLTGAIDAAGGRFGFHSGTACAQVFG